MNAQNAGDEKNGAVAGCNDDAWNFFGAAAKEEREVRVLVLVLASKKIRRGQIRFEIAADGVSPANRDAHFDHEPWQGRV
jgi:hypothetical protein